MFVRIFYRTIYKSDRNKSIWRHHNAFYRRRRQSSPVLSEQYSFYRLNLRICNTKTFYERRGFICKRLTIETVYKIIKFGYFFNQTPIPVSCSTHGKIRKFIFSYKSFFLHPAKRLQNKRKRSRAVSSDRTMKKQGVIIGIRTHFKFVAESVAILIAAVNACFAAVIIRAVYRYKIYSVSERGLL